MQDIYFTFEFSKILSYISEFSKSEIGKQKVLSLRMLPSKEEVDKSLKELEEVMEIIFRFGPLPISSSVDTLKLIEIAKKTGLLSPRDLYLIGNDVITSKDLILYSKKINLNYPFLNEQISKFYDLSNLEKEIRRVVTSSLTVDDHASDKLFEIRTKIKKLENSINSKAASLAYSYGQYLSDENATIRDGHFVLPVKTAYKSKVLGAIYDVSDTGNTTFIEPLEIITLNNEITSLKIEENEEVRKILKTLTNIILLQEDEIINNNKIIGNLDFISSKAQYALLNNDIIATSKEEQYLELKNARHPLIDPQKVVANSYHADENKRLVVISGPNAGGKTVSLKTIGLIVLMNQCGLAIPASKAELGYFKNIYIDIGDNQSLSDNLSTFSAHMTQIGEITRAVRGKDLVLIDELGTGTDPREGEALAIAVSKHLINSHAICFISSHFSGLKEFALTNPVIENSSMLFDEENLSPTYRFKLGAPGRSYGMEVAERYGISNKIIEDAKNYLSINSRSETEELIASLQKKVENASKIEEQLKKDKEEFEKEYKKLQNDQKILKERRESLLMSVKEEKQEMLEQTKEELSRIIKMMSKNNLSLNEVIELKKQVEDLEEKEENEIYNEQIVVGDNVSIPSLELYGKVDRIKGSKAHFISDTGISLEVDLNRLHKVEKSEKRAVHKVSKPVELDLKSVPIELNIIGMHTEEGREALMTYLDNCRYKHMAKVRIIHGFGSGVLRKMVHSYLDKQKDLTYKLADGYEGGGGATVVIFNERKN
ncbi:MAG: hypothetical protein E7178_00755 [Erysipelotrichaceae bacterium]|jgi:DNA mismatch repair protein MutS2|nr:hypothetical protein [Erysipelotrichaceae bacterium]